MAMFDGYGWGNRPTEKALLRMPPAQGYSSTGKSSSSGLRDLEASSERCRLGEAKRINRELLAQSSLQQATIGMLLCIFLYLAILMARLELQSVISWPYYVDFIPLGIFPILLYSACADFATTQIREEASLGRIVLVGTGFCTAVILTMANVFVMLRMSHGIRWSWTSTLMPLWSLVVLAQLFFCFTLPGFLKANLLRAFVAAYVTCWLMSLTALLVALKLDGQIPILAWRAVFVPVQLCMLLQLTAMSNRSVVDTVGFCVVLGSLVMLPIQLDGNLHWPWSAFLLPILAVLVLKMIEVGKSGKELDNEL